MTEQALSKELSLRKPEKFILERHLRHKFAIELFISIQGFPLEVSFFPSDNIVEAWKVCYLLKGKDLDGFYLEKIVKNTKAWKQLESQPIHLKIPEDVKA